MSRFTVWITQPEGNPSMRCFAEVALSLSSALRRLGHDVLEPKVSDAPFVTNALVPPDGDFGRSIVLGSNFLPDAPYARDTIFYNLEQIAVDGDVGAQLLRSNLLRLMRRHTVWDYSQHNIALLKTLGCPDVRYCPIGFVPELVRIPEAEQDIDVLHYGHLEPGGRRMRILNALDQSAVVVDGVQRQLRVEHFYGLYGEERDRMIARAKVVLNMHHYGKDFGAGIFEIVRCSYLYANKKCVVSESGGPDQTLEALATACGAHVPYDKLVETCVALVEHPGTRVQVAAAGLDNFWKLNFTESVRRALEH